MKNRIISMILMAVAVLGLTACGNSYDTAKAEAAGAYDSYDDSYAYDYNYDYADNAMAEEAAYDEYAGEDMYAYSEGNGAQKIEVKENATATNRKLIRRVSLSVETKEYDALNTNIMNEINDCGGYIESMEKYNGSIYESSYNNQIQNRTCYLVARIPANKLDGFIGKVGEKANITNQSESVDDVTLSYVDMSTHRDMLKEEQERLLGFLEEAETVDEIISLEDRLTEVRYQLESMESTIRTYDNQVDYSTVNIDIREVATYTPSAPAIELTPGERIKKGFAESMESIGHGFQEFFIGFVINLPYIILVVVLLAIAGLIALLIVKRTNKKAQDNAKKEEAGKQNIQEKPEGTFVSKPNNKK